MTAAAEELWRLIEGLCPPGPPPCAAIARRTGLADATVSDWFRKRYVPPWPRFHRFLAYFPEPAHGRLVAAWRAAREAQSSGPSTSSPASLPPTSTGTPAPRLVQLPHDIADFTGRGAEVDQITELLTRDEGSGLTLVGIEGMAGSGKTRLAVHVLRRAGRQLGDVQLYVDLGGGAPGREPVAAADVLGSLLRHLGVPDAEVPADLDDRAALYRSRLEDVQAVILLDDAAGADQVRPLLPGSPRCRVLITSRRSLDGLDGYRPVRLDSFDEHDSVTLVERIVGVDRVAAEPEAVRRLVALTAHLPLAVSLAARRLRSRPAWRVSDLVDRLEVEGSRLAELTASDVAVRAVFTLSYDQLDRRRRQVFRRLAAHPGREFDPYAVAALAGVTVPEATADLESLLDEHLVLSVGPDRYAQHDLLALFARERFAAEDDETARAATIRRALDWYLRTAVRAKELIGPDGRRMPLVPSEVVPYPLATAAQANDWYDRERLGLDAVLRTAVAHGHDDLAWQLPITLFGFCRSRQSWQQFRGQLATAQAAARRAGDDAGIAWTHISTGIGECFLGHRDVGEEHFLAAARIYRDLGDTEGEGVALNNLGENRRLAGDFAGAIELFGQDLNLSRARGDAGAIASSLNNIGKAELGRGRLDAADAALSEALERAGHADDQHARAEVRHDLGQVALARSATGDAATHFRAAAALYEELGDLAAAAASLADLAEVSRDEHQLQVAHRLLPRIDEPFAGRLADRLEGVRASLRRAEDRTAAPRGGESGGG